MSSIYWVPSKTLSVLCTTSSGINRTILTPIAELVILNVLSNDRVTLTFDLSVSYLVLCYHNIYFSLTNHYLFALESNYVTMMDLGWGSAIHPHPQHSIKGHWCHLQSFSGSVIYNLQWKEMNAFNKMIKLKETKVLSLF